jgi:hypothetical protein
MTLDELKSKLPTSLQPFADTYGPMVLQWSAAEVTAWITRLAQGDVEGAYRTVLKAQGNDDFFKAGDALVAQWKADNVANKASMDLQKTASLAILKVVLELALAAVGL